MYQRENTLNFDSINNISDLLEANKQADPTEAIHEMIAEAVAEHGPGVALQVAIGITSRLLQLHDTVAEEHAEEGDCDKAITWAQDSRTLQMALAMLNTIEL